MIKSVFLRNIQSHKASKVDFHPGLNIIIGATDSGKSGFLRGLKWPITNRPSGNELKSNWGGNSLVKIETDEAIITRSKGDKEEYTLTTAKGKLVFHAFGTNIPQEISDAFNMSSINIQSQLDSPFLLSETPGAVATHFNKVARLDKIDTATENINSWVRALDSKVKHLQEDLVNETEKLTQYKNLQKFEIELEVLEEMEKRQTTKIASVKRLNNIIEEIELVERKILKKSKMIPIGKLIDTILTSIEEKKVLNKSYEQLINLTSNINCTQENIESNQSVLSLETEVNGLLALFADKNTLNVQFSTLNKAVLLINNTKVALSKANANLSLQIKEFENNIGKICPLCDQPIKKGHKHEKDNEA